MKLGIKRLISQIFFLIYANLGFKIEGVFPGLKTGFCYPFFYCHACPANTSACPIRAIEIGVFKGNWNWKFILYPLLIIGFVGVLSGRAVCGWACPIGFLQRVTGKIPRMMKKRFKFISKVGQHKIEPYLRYIKYVVLILLVFITPILIGFMFTDICPVGYLVGTIPIILLNPGQYAPNEFFYIALVVFILFIILIFLIERGWCKYFCPVGALFAPFNKISYLHMDVDVEACINCQLCSQVCPMGIDIPTMNRDLECILCGKCIEQCPRGLINFKRD